MEVKTTVPHVMTEVLKHVEEVMNFIDKYEISRPGTQAFIKLEEALLWLQVMVGNVALKKVEVTAEPEIVTADEC